MARAMTPHLLFAGGDPGGARCLLPVIKSALEQGIDIRVLAHGWLEKQVKKMPDPGLLIDEEELVSTAFSMPSSVLIFSSSVSDLLPLRLAFRLKALGIPIIHVLDHWSNYARRLTTDDGMVLEVDVYTALDDLSKEQIKASRIKARKVVVTGSPALEALFFELSNLEESDEISHLKRDKMEHKSPVLLWASEPVTQDQGNSKSPFYRGYTEEDAFYWFTQLLMQFVGEDIELLVAPHPREDVARLESIVRSYWPSATLLKAGEGRKGVLMAQGVCGMASMLLYEAWLWGKSVLSLQPNARSPIPFSHMKTEDDFFLVLDVNRQKNKFKEFLTQGLKKKDEGYQRTKRAARFSTHMGAAQRILMLGVELSKTRFNGEAF